MFFFLLSMKITTCQSLIDLIYLKYSLRFLQHLLFFFLCVFLRMLEKKHKMTFESKQWWHVCSLMKCTHSVQESMQLQELHLLLEQLWFSFFPFQFYALNLLTFYRKIENFGHGAEMTKDCIFNFRHCHHGQLLVLKRLLQQDLASAFSSFM